MGSEAGTIRESVGPRLISHSAERLAEAILPPVRIALNPHFTTCFCLARGIGPSGETALHTRGFA